MKKIKLLIASLLMAASITSFAQNQEKSSNTKLIAVVNSANWCGVCKAHGERFGKTLLPYASKGVNIYMNDISNDSTKTVSKQALEKANVYEAISTSPRKGMGKALKACHMVKDKKVKDEVAGIVTFIDPVTHKQIKQVSIAMTDEEMKNLINKLLN